MKLEWNAGGWFGGQIGVTAWILVAALLTAFQDKSTALILLVVFAIPNILGFALWRRRHDWSCYYAMLVLLFAAAVFGSLAVFVLENRGLWESIQLGGSVSASSAYVIIILVVFILMATFYFRFGRGSNGNSA